MFISHQPSEGVYALVLTALQPNSLFRLSLNQLTYTHARPLPTTTTATNISNNSYQKYANVVYSEISAMVIYFQQWEHLQNVLIQTHTTHTHTHTRARTHANIHIRTHMPNKHKHTHTYTNTHTTRTPAGANLT